MGSHMNFKMNKTSISDFNVNVEVTTTINTLAYSLAGWLDDWLADGWLADGWVAHGWMT